MNRIPGDDFITYLVKTQKEKERNKTAEEKEADKKKKRNRKRREKKKRNRKKKQAQKEFIWRPSGPPEGMFGICGWWRLREDHPLQLLANDFAKEFDTPQFPLHITYSYGDDATNRMIRNEYINPHPFDPVKLKKKVCKPPDDRWEWFVLPIGPDFEEDIIYDNGNYRCFHSIQLRVELYDLININSPCYAYHMSLAYTVVDEEERDIHEEYGFKYNIDIHEGWFYDMLPERITLKNEDFIGELWDCSSKNVEDWKRI